MHWIPRKAARGKCCGGTDDNHIAALFYLGEYGITRRSRSGKQSAFRRQPGKARCNPRLYPALAIAPRSIEHDPYFIGAKMLRKSDATGTK